jgi:hypothetical protein
MGVKRESSTKKTKKRDGDHSFPMEGWAQSHTARVYSLGDSNDQSSNRNGCSGWLARWRAPDRSICAARGNRSTARRLHGGRPDVVQLGDSEQGTHSELLGVEDGSAYAAVPGSVCQALTNQRFDLYVAERNWDSMLRYCPDANSDPQEGRSAKSRYDRVFASVRVHGSNPCQG